jgi:hypothetical protein
VVGKIVAAGISIAQSSLVDLPTALLAALSLLALVRLKVDTMVVLIGAGLVGTLLL